MKMWQIAAVYTVCMTALFVGYILLTQQIAQEHDAKIRQQTIQEVCK